MHEAPDQAHLWLKRFVGTWTSVSHCSFGPDAPPIQNTGRETVRQIGDLWIVAEGDVLMADGSSMTSLMSVGYDPKLNRFVGSWLCSMMSKLWIYNGQLNDTGDTLNLDAEGPSFSDPTKTALYRDATTFREDGLRLFTSSFLTDDQQWTKFMTIEYRREK